MSPTEDAPELWRVRWVTCIPRISASVWEQGRCCRFCVQLHSPRGPSNGWFGHCFVGQTTKRGPVDRLIMGLVLVVELPLVLGFCYPVLPLLACMAMALN